jgi:hypothetical protein
VAVNPPATCVAINPGTSQGRIPTNVLLSVRAIVTAGFAKEVDAVNQYAAAMYAPTANAVALDRTGEHPQITDSNPRRKYPSAIWLRAEFPVQRNKTFGFTRSLL